MSKIAVIPHARLAEMLAARPFETLERIKDLVRAEKAECSRTLVDPYDRTLTERRGLILTGSNIDMDLVSHELSNPFAFGCRPVWCIFESA